MIHVPRLFVDNPIHQQLATVRRYCCYIYEGRFTSLIIYGPEGIGKTFVVEQVALSFGQPFNRQRPGTILGLIHVLIDEQGGVVVLDDCDKFWHIAEGLNALKTALDTRDRRIISHTTATGTTTIPPTEITSRVIQISNLDFGDPSKFSKDIKPILNRSLLIGLSFNPLDLYEYTCGLIVEEGMLRRPIKMPGKTDHLLSRAAVNEILKHLCDNANRYPSLSPRTLAQIIAPLRAGSDYDQWRADVEGLMRTPAQMAANPRVFKNAAGEVITKLHCYQLPEGKRPPPPPKGLAEPSTAAPGHPPPPRDPEPEPSATREPTEEEIAEVQGVIDEMIDAGILPPRDPPPPDDIVRASLFCLDAAGKVISHDPKAAASFKVGFSVGDTRFEHTRAEHPFTDYQQAVKVYKAIQGKPFAEVARFLAAEAKREREAETSAPEDNAEVEIDIAEVKDRLRAGAAAAPWWEGLTADGLVDRHRARAARNGAQPMTLTEHLALDCITDRAWRDRFEGQITRGLAAPQTTHATSSGKMIPAKDAGRFHHLLGTVYLPKPPGKRGRPPKQ